MGVGAAPHQGIRNNLELNSSICNLSLLERLQVGPSLSQLMLEIASCKQRDLFPPPRDPSCSHSSPARAEGAASLTAEPDTLSWLPSADTSSPH